MSAELILGIIGTVTSLAITFFTLWEKLKERPIIKISDVLLHLEKKEEDKIVGRLSFNVDNLGDRSTTVVRVNVILGDHVEVVEGLRDISPHSSVKYPETSSEIKLFTRYREVENLRIIIIHTHDTLEKIYKLPQVSEWNKFALWKDGPLLLQP